MHVMNCGSEQFKVSDFCVESEVKSTFLEVVS